MPTEKMCDVCVHFTFDWKIEKSIWKNWCSKHEQYTEPKETCDEFEGCYQPKEDK